MVTLWSQHRKFMLALIGWGTDLALKRKEAVAEKRWVWKLKSKSKH